MDPTTPAGIRQTYKSAFLKGLAAILPTLITVYVLLWVYGGVRDNIAAPINNAIKAQLTERYAGRQFALRQLEVSPDALNDPALFERELDARFPSWVGFAAAVALCFSLGFFIASFVGRRVWSAAETWLHRLPVVSAIYPAAKQVTDFFISDGGQGAQFSRVGLVPFPAHGQWSVGLVMADGFKDLDVAIGKRHLPIFVPMSPTPVTGFVCMVPETDFIALDMSVDEAFKFYLTCGLVIPDRLKLGSAAAADGLLPGAAIALPGSAGPAGPLPAAAPAGARA
jgi:uncharacterized membrane protein